MNKPSSENRFKWLTHHGEMAARIREFDWSRTALGLPETWPLSLKNALNLCLETKFPANLWWGPELINFYNDAYIKLAGANKHPQYFGISARHMWQEIWPTLEGYIERIYGGELLFFEDHMFPLEREGVREEAYFSFSYAPARDDDGEINGIFCVCNESTKVVKGERSLKKAYAEVEKSHQQLHDFFMQAPIPMVMLEEPDLKFTLVNPPYEKLIGKNPLGKKLKEAFSPEEYVYFLPLLEEVYQTGTPHIGREKPLKVKGDDGLIHESWIDFGYFPFRNESGKIIGIMVFVQDVTEQVETKKQIERNAEELFIEKQKLETMFANSPAGLALMRGPSLTFEKINETWKKLVSEREYLGRTYNEVYPEIVDTPFPGQVSDVYVSGKPFSGQVRAKVEVRTGEYAERIYDVNYVQVKDSEGKPYGVFAHGLDVTEKVHNQDRLQSLVQDLKVERDLRENFVAALTHDLRTPLTAAMMGAQILGRKASDQDKVRQVAGRIVDNMGRADHMIRDILDASRVKAGEKILVKKSDCELVSICKDTIEDLSSLHGDRFKLESKSQINGQWDCSSIRRILENLINNAIKYGSSVEPVTIYLREGDDKAFIEVHNCGNPIPEDELKYIFKPYHRLKSTHSATQKGWGIGLTLVHGLVKEHGGDVQVTSSKKEGTTFTVELPKNSKL